MTRREIAIALRKINVRTHNEFVMDASLRGIQLEPISDVELERKYTAEEEAKLDRAMKAAQERKRREATSGTHR